MAAPHPERIGKYAIRRALGRGAMGTVYEGWDEIIERRVAIKTILREYLENAEALDAIARFKREAQAGGRLNHPAIVGVHEYGEDDGGAYIVMEYVEGKELRQYFRMANRFDLIDVFEIMKQLLLALDYSHRQGVVHRDIKPANLMILPGMKLKIMDFGIARIESSSLTQVGTVVGTPTHMSPEQLAGLPADGRADVWSAGVILYELLTGVSPFMGDTPVVVMNKVLQAQPDPPSRLVPSLPEAFDAVVARALGKKADERFQSAREFHAALLAAFQGRAVQARRGAGDPERTLDPQAAAKVEASRTAGGAASASYTLPPDKLLEVERSLSRSIGPLAGVLIKQAQARSTSANEFFDHIAAHIEDESERKAFLDKLANLRRAQAPEAPSPAPPSPAGATRSGSAPAARAEITSEMLSTAEKRLASYVGPLARVLIKDAAGKSGNLRELYAQLAEHIDDEAERKAFLGSLGR
ncbi:MAG: serine/threonine protein kinase [Betaproteobacteria bacterium]|nr:serine/threonine protein kinase [Betaproteobacteria bacterium]